jgi:hypothetical protein
MRLLRWLSGLRALSVLGNKKGPEEAHAHRPNLDGI